MKLPWVLVIWIICMLGVACYTVVWGVVEEIPLLLRIAVTLVYVVGSILMVLKNKVAEGDDKENNGSDCS